MLETQEALKEKLDNAHYKKEEHIITQVWKHYEIMKNFFQEGAKKFEEMENIMSSMKQYSNHLSQTEWLNDQFMIRLESLKTEISHQEYENLKEQIKLTISQIRQSKINEDPSYLPLCEILAKSKILVTALASSATTNGVLDSLVIILDSVGGLLSLLKQEISIEVQSCMHILNKFFLFLTKLLHFELALTPSTLFRGNSLATKLMSAIARVSGLGYVKKLLQPYFDMIASNPHSFEIDKFQNLEQKKENVENVKKICQELLNDFFNSVEKFPSMIKLVATVLRQESNKKFPEFVNSVIGGFIFLRFLGPMFLNPTSFKLVQGLFLLCKTKSPHLLILYY